MIAHSNAKDARKCSDSLGEICEQYRRELRRFFQRRAPRTDWADDLVQRVYLRLLRSPPVALVHDPRQYMYRVAWNVLRSENKRVRREELQAFSCDAEHLERLASEVGVLWVDDSTEAVERERLESALCQLPRACQVAFLRQYRDGHSYKEIAAELGVTPHAVKKYIVKALHHFRMHFHADDADSR